MKFFLKTHFKCPASLSSGCPAAHFPFLSSLLGKGSLRGGGTTGVGAEAAKEEQGGVEVHVGGFTQISHGKKGEDEELMTCKHTGWCSLIYIHPNTTTATQSN